MTGKLEVFIHHCIDTACGGERLERGMVRRVKLTLSDGRRLAFDTKEEALEAAKKNGVAVTLGEGL